jgi:hypothetical protein
MACISYPWIQAQAPGRRTWGGGRRAVQSSEQRAASHPPTTKKGRAVKKFLTKATYICRSAKKKVVTYFILFLFLFLFFIDFF